MKTKVYSLYLGTILFAFSSCSDSGNFHADLPSDEYFTTEITIDEARKNLVEILQYLDNSGSRSGCARRIAESYTTNFGSNDSRSEESSTMYHVFNFENKEGFAIMSSDVRIPELLALADSGSLVVSDTVNTGLRIFLDNLNRIKIDTPLVIKPNPYPNNPDYPPYAYTEEPFYIYGEWSRPYVYKRYGYCKVKWGQGSPYNKYCKYDKGEQCYTGCTATAVAQLMSIYKYPESYDGYSYDWDNMTAYSSASKCSENAQNDIAKLMIQLGYSNNLDIKYEKDRSHAQTSDAVRTFEHFGYSSPGVYARYYNTEVVEDLKKGYPVILRGRNSNDRGHAWVVHGLMNEHRTVKKIQYGRLVNTSTENIWYLLCNWGWDGLADGYYCSFGFDATKGAMYGDGSETGYLYDSNSGTHSQGDFINVSEMYAITGIRK